MISILMVNFNGGDLVLATLAKVQALRAEGPPFEVIVADNGSTDGSRERIEKAFPKVLVLCLGRNLGFGAANNRAAAIARGESLLLLNSDAWPEPGALERLHRALHADPRRALACPLLRYADGRPQFHGGPWTGVAGEAWQKLRNPFERWPFIHQVGVDWFTAACVLLRRQAFEEVGGFDERFFLYFEDVDLCRRLVRAGWRLHLEPSATAVHLKGGSQPGDGTTLVAGLGASELEYRRGQLRYYAKHRPPWEQRFLHRRLRRKFERLPPGNERERLLDLLEEPSRV
jgi:N-acetylglucosaminyl-diphospho-decaprenol L-rhamnosyltransferase